MRTHRRGPSPAGRPTRVTPRSVLTILVAIGVVAGLGLAASAQVALGTANPIKAGGPFSSSQLQGGSTAPKQPHAEPAALSPCPMPVGPPGIFVPPPGLFHAAEGLFTNGARLIGQNGAEYEVYAGIHAPIDRPVAGPNDVAAGNAGFLLVRRYPSASVDPCTALNQHGTEPFKSLEYPVPSRDGAPTITQISADQVGFRTRGGTTGWLDVDNGAFH
jgi:hypothetical protein